MGKLERTIPDIFRLALMVQHGCHETIARSLLSQVNVQTAPVALRGVEKITDSLQSGRLELHGGHIQGSLDFDRLHVDPG